MIVGRATYFDGQTAVPHPVRIELARELTVISEADGKEVARWLLKDIRRLQSAPEQFRLAQEGGLARLEFGDRRFFNALVKCAPKLDAASDTDRRTIIRIVGWSFAAIVSLFLIVLFLVPLLAERIVPLVPIEYETQLGKSYERVFIGRVLGGQICGAKLSEGAKALDVIRERLLAEFSSPYQYEITVVKHKMVNAFALPGGRVVLTSGLLIMAAKPEELASVLAHEFGHVENRDGLRHMISASATSLVFGLLLGDFVGGTLLIAAAEHMINANHSREAERAADKFSIEIMQHAKLSPRHGATIFSKFKEMIRDGRLPAVLNTHPDLNERIERARNADVPVQQKALLSPNQWEALQNICEITQTFE